MKYLSNWRKINMPQFITLTLNSKSSCQQLKSPLTECIEDTARPSCSHRSSASGTYSAVPTAPHHAGPPLPVGTRQRSQLLGSGQSCPCGGNPRHFSSGSRHLSVSEDTRAGQRRRRRDDVGSDETRRRRAVVQRTFVHIREISFP